MKTTSEGALAEVFLDFLQTDRSAAVSALGGRLSRCKPDDGGFATASLLAELLQQSPHASEDSSPPVDDDEAYGLLLIFIRNALDQTDPGNIPRLRSIIDLCKQDPALTEPLVQTCICTFRKEIELLQANSAEWAVPTAASLDDVAENDQTRLSTVVPPVHLDTIKCIAFLRVFFWSASCPTVMVEEVKLLLLILVGASLDISSRCNDTLLALISREGSIASQYNHLNADGEGKATTFIWNRLLELTSTCNGPRYRDIGFSLWLRLVSSKNEPFPSRSILQCEVYWATLREGLASGTAQHRKACLSILKSSLALLDGDMISLSMRFASAKQTSFLHEYAKFSILFETIVLARYLNQVQACLPDLLTISLPESKVQETWVVALLTGALANGMQDSVRKVIGDWTLSYGASILQRAILDAPDFLETSFLPWASIGYLFTSSIRHVSERELVCYHGERVCTFLTDLFLSQMDQLDRANSLKAILKFLIAKGGLIFPYARAYVLDGLITALTRLEYSLDAEALGMILSISSMAGFQGMVRDLMTLQCGNLADLAGESARSERNIKPLCKECSLLESSDELHNHHANSSQYLQASASLHATRIDPEWTSSGSCNAPSLHLFNTWVNVSNHRCLAGREGLQAAVSYLLDALDSSESDIVLAEDLDRALSAVWDEAQVQEYPKFIMMRISKLLFHPKCVRQFAPGNGLKTTVSDCALGIQRIAENRVYAFPPLAAALRKAFLLIPEAEELPFLDLYTRFANNPPLTKIEFDLEKLISGRLEAFVPSRTYSAYYGKGEGYGYACMFDILNRLPNTTTWYDLRQQVLDDILGLWIHQKHPVPMVSKWKTTSQLQIMLILSEALVPIWSTDEIDRYLKSYQDILALEPLPRFRYLLEWIVARVYVHKSNRRSEILQALSDQDLANPRLTVSGTKLALALACLPDCDEAFALEFMTQLIPLSASPKIAIRHEAHWTLPLLWDRAIIRDWKSMLDNPAFGRLNEHIRGLDTYKNPPPGRMLKVFDAIEDHTMTNLIEGEYLSIEPSEPPKLLRDDFVAVWKDDPLSETAGLLPIGEPKGRHRGFFTPIVSSYRSTETSSESTSAIPLQTKASTWEDLVLDTFDPTSGSEARRAKEVIVISSLINNAYNVGGLSRVSEIFGVQSLQVANRDVIKNKDFTSVSVSSHFWLPMEELDTDAIPEFLVRRKLEGYTIVGVEQTDSSRVLGQKGWKFPKKTVLLLGSEREGIPARLLGDMDFCVEIAQVGITRSMNVQTAAAVVLYEYSRQHP